MDDTTKKPVINRFPQERTPVWIERPIHAAAKRYGQQKRPRWSITDVVNHWARKGMKASGVSVLEPQQETQP